MSNPVTTSVEGQNPENAPTNNGDPHFQGNHVLNDRYSDGCDACDQCPGHFEQMGPGAHQHRRSGCDNDPTDPNFPKFKIIDFEPNGLEDSSGDAYTVEVDGLGKVRCEKWYSSNSSGFDCYTDEGYTSKWDGEIVRVGTPCNDAVLLVLGDSGFDALEEACSTVYAAYFAELAKLGFNEIKKQATAAALAAQQH